VSITVTIKKRYDGYYKLAVPTRGQRTFLLICMRADAPVLQCSWPG